MDIERVVAERLRDDPEWESVPLWTREDIEAVTIPQEELEERITARLVEELSQYSAPEDIPPPLPHQRVTAEWMRVEPCGDNDPEEHDDRLDATIYAWHTLSPVYRQGQSPWLTGRVSSMRGIPLRSGERVPVPLEMDIEGSSDAHRMRFDLERTENCWRDECGAESDPESETGLCTDCRTEMRSRWTE
jgi:hypothetical protein